MVNENFKSPDYTDAELSRMMEGESFKVGDRIEALRNGSGIITKVETKLSFFVEFDNGKAFWLV